MQEMQLKLPLLFQKKKYFKAETTEIVTVYLAIKNYLKTKCKFIH